MVGQTLGSYKLVSEIGKGGMGVVYLAEHTLLGRKAAVKLLRPDVPNDQVERFFNEAKSVATLHHPGLVDVLDFGTATDGRAFIVMEYLVGESLAERLDRDPRLPVPIAGTIARHVANALTVAHDEGIIHRDLKPANIFLVPDAESPAGVRAKVLDFGIAKLVRDRGQRSVHTHSGAVIGTPRYMSPEQCKNAREVDGRADIYSLGCILFEMLLGVAPYDYDNWAELVSAHMHEAVPKPSDLDPTIPKDVETLILKMLAKKAADRHQTMNEVAQCLEVILREHANDWPVRLTPVSGIRRPTPANLDPTLLPSGEMPIVTQPATTPLPPASVRTEPKKRTPWLAIGLAAGGVLALAGAAVLVLAGTSKPETNDTAFIVVDERERPVEKHDVPVPVPVDASVVAEPAVDAGVKKPSNATDTGALTRTFGRQRDAVAACFRDHPDDAQELSVRFSIDTSGKVLTADVLPANVATTALGKCVHDVAVATSFGAQPKAASFRVGPIQRRQ
jgi:serine/threonine-protein kinase